MYLFLKKNTVLFTLCFVNVKYNLFDFPKIFVNIHQ